MRIKQLMQWSYWKIRQYIQFPMLILFITCTMEIVGHSSVCMALLRMLMLTWKSLLFLKLWGVGKIGINFFRMICRFQKFFLFLKLYGGNQSVKGMMWLKDEAKYRMPYFNTLHHTHYRNKWAHFFLYGIV